MFGETMKAVVLAGGFAKRMWPLTKDKPKHLLPVAGRPMLDYVMEKLETVSEIDRIFIATNAKYKDQFKDYLGKREAKKNVSLFIEDALSEGEKLGSVGGLGYLIRQNSIDDELLVIGGDNILGFEMLNFIDFFQLKGQTWSRCMI